MNTLPMSPRDITDISHLFKHMGQPETGVEGQFIKAQGPSACAVLWEGTTPCQEDSFLGPQSTHTPISRELVEPSSKDSFNPQPSKPSVTIPCPRAGVRPCFLCV